MEQTQAAYVSSQSHLYCVATSDRKGLVVNGKIEVKPAQHTEAVFEAAIEQSLLTRGGYEELVLKMSHHEISQIGLLIEKINKSIELLCEYRTALISSAVTGKIDVREAAA